MCCSGFCAAWSEYVRQGRYNRTGSVSLEEEEGEAPKTQRMKRQRCRGVGYEDGSLSPSESRGSAERHLLPAWSGAEPLLETFSIDVTGVRGHLIILQLTKRNYEKPG